MEKHVLSKSTFIRGLQCSKSLYLYKNFIQLRDTISAEQKAIFNRGNAVGLLAQKLFPGGVDATPTKRSDNIAAVERTQQLIQSGAEVIYEAAFCYEKVLVILDILVKNTAANFPVKGNWDNNWYAYEVKSSTKISNTYLLDASLQYWVITKTGLPLLDISLVTINNQYIRNGNIEVDKLFAIKSVKHDVLKNQELVEDKVNLSKQVLAEGKMPDIEIGEQCFSPYTCDYMGTCWKGVSKDSIFEITAIPKSEQFKLYRSGIKTITDIPENNELDKNANIHIKAFKNKAAFVDKPSIKKFLDKAVYPLFFMDFETFMPAVPLYNQTQPYQHLPFQYSLHYKKSKDAPLEHLYFLAEQGSDPRFHFLKSLLEHTQSQGTILVYDALMERNVLNGLKKLFPEYTTEIEERLSRMVDLMQPFQERSYYHPAMKNSHSIKNILHALVPDLRYSDLKISEGSMAMVAFEQLQTETDMFKVLETREHLHEYCKLDTLAMVKVFEILEDSVR